MARVDDRVTAELELCRRASLCLSQLPPLSLNSSEHRSDLLREGTAHSVLDSFTRISEATRVLQFV